jgi:hypothetical protein
LTSNIQYIYQEIGERRKLALKLENINIRSEGKFYQQVDQGEKGKIKSTVKIIVND